LFLGLRHFVISGILVFRAQGLVFRAQGLVFKAQGLVFRAQGQVFRAPGLVLRAQGLGTVALVLILLGVSVHHLFAASSLLWLRVWGLGFRNLSLGSGV
jgi:hypothetical protein